MVLNATSPVDLQSVIDDTVISFDQQIISQNLMPALLILLGIFLLTTKQ